jgi:membrane-associated protease RseP (regulator of RpoE activity)
MREPIAAILTRLWWDFGGSDFLGKCCVHSAREIASLGGSVMVKHFAPMVVAIVAGSVVATLVWSDRRSKEVGVEDRVELSVVGDASGRSDLNRPIPDVQSHLASDQSGSAITDKPAPMTLQEVKAKGEVVLKKIDQVDAEIRKEKLLAAGFSTSRIEWIEKRNQQLQEEYAWKRSTGTLDREDLAANGHDKDIGLRSEMGDVEFERYRQALGRPIGMEVASVSWDGNGAAAGLKVGDQILAYNGTRMFTAMELNQLEKKYATSGTTIPVDVLRNGERIEVNVPAGNLSLQQALEGQVTTGLTYDSKPIEGMSREMQLGQGWIKQMIEREPKMRALRAAEAEAEAKAKAQTNVAGD